MATDTKNAKLLLGVETKGTEKTTASLKEIEGELKAVEKAAERALTEGTKGASQFQQELAKLSRASQLDKLANEFGNIAKKTKDTGAAVAELTKRLKLLGATKEEISGVASTFNQAAGLSGGGGRGEALRLAGSQLRALPSVQIPGLGIGTDAVANITRLSGALTEAADKTKLVTTVTTALTPALGASAASLVALAGAAALVAAPILAVVVALKALSDQAAKEADVVNAIIDNQRKVSQDIAKGATSEELTARLKELTALRDDETQRLNDLKQRYQDNIEGQGALSGALKVFSGAEDALAGQIDKSDKATKDFTGEIDAIEDALSSGATAANDMKAAEEELKKTREKEASDILQRAQIAGQEIQSQSKALKATEAQNLDRLESIEDEKKAIQAQLEVLQTSGNTTDKVTDQIEQLTRQLDNLGKETAFINDTALEVSRANDAEKKAKEDEKKAIQQAEHAAEQAANAQLKYAQTVEDSAVRLSQAADDIDTKLNQNLVDNLKNFNRTLNDLSVKYKEDEFDIELKAARAEEDALTKHLEDIEDVRKDAREAELEAIRDGDFKALFLARQKNLEEAKDNQKQVNREAQERRTDAQRAREDLARNFQRERNEKLVAFERSNADARQNANRELQQAQLARSRALEAAQTAYNRELQQLNAYLQARNQLQAQANNQALQQQSRGIPGGGIPGTGLAGAGISGSGIAGNGISGQGISALNTIIKK